MDKVITNPFSGLSQGITNFFSGLGSPQIMTYFYDKPVVTLLWGSDWHLDHLSQEKRTAFYAKLKSEDFDLLVLSGDIELSREDSKRGSQGLLKTLRKIQEVIRRPIFFICGNHDYYLGSIHDLRVELKALTLKKDHMLYLEEEKVIQLSPRQALIGIDGWADGRSGDFFKSDMELQDFFQIKELEVKNVSQIPREATLTKMQTLADASSMYIKQILPELFKIYEQVFLVTHFPPFREAALYMGEPSNNSAVPFFVNQRLGETIVVIMKERKDKQLTVLCGHTHHAAVYSPLPNVLVTVSGSDYGSPTISEKFVFIKD